VTRIRPQVAALCTLTRQYSFCSCTIAAAKTCSVQRKLLFIH
jgi:hypothetical protein